MRLSGLIGLGILLAGCAAQTCEERHYAICNELNRQIIYLGATSNPHLAMQQRAQLQRVLKSYHDEGC